MIHLYTVTQEKPTHFQVCYAGQPILEIPQQINTASLEQLLDRCSAEELDPLHLPEVLEDYLWAVFHGYTV